MAGYRAFAIKSFEELFERTDEIIKLYEATVVAKRNSSLVLSSELSSSLSSFSLLLLRNAGKPLTDFFPPSPPSSEVILCHDMKVCFHFYLILILFYFEDFYFNLLVLFIYFYFYLNYDFKFCYGFILIFSFFFAN